MVQIKEGVNKKISSLLHRAGLKGRSLIALCTALLFLAACFTVVIIRFWPQEPTLPEGTENQTQLFDFRDENSSEFLNGDDSSSSTSKANSTQKMFVVYITGAVAHPDIYELPEGSRVADAIESAGGSNDDAALQAVNLARKLMDGEQIVIPTIEELEQDGGLGGAVGTSTNASSTVARLVNINTADSVALETLTGIGEATAEKIIADREENGPFMSIEDLKRVSGIGDKKFEQLKDEICV